MKQTAWIAGITTIVLSGCASVRDAQKVSPGMERETVIEHLGSPDDRSAQGAGEKLFYNLQNGNKFWQAVLAVPALGINFLFKTGYIVELNENKVTSIYVNPDQTSASAGRRGFGAALQGMGGGLQNQKTIHCSSTSQDYGYAIQTDTQCQ